MRGRATLALLGAIGLTVAVAAAALAAPAGPYRGTTTEHGAVHFTVKANAVVNFTTTDGYNSDCDYSIQIGGLPYLTVTIKSMAISSTGRFSGRVTESNRPITGTSVVAVTGRITGGRAIGTVTVVGKTCGSLSPTPTASMYHESYSASRT